MSSSKSPSYEMICLLTYNAVYLLVRRCYFVRHDPLFIEKEREVFKELWAPPSAQSLRNWSRPPFSHCGKRPCSSKCSMPETISLKNGSPLFFHTGHSSPVLDWNSDKNLYKKMVWKSFKRTVTTLFHWRSDVSVRKRRNREHG